MTSLCEPRAQVGTDATHAQSALQAVLDLESDERTTEALAAFRQVSLPRLQVRSHRGKLWADTATMVS